MKYWEVVKRLTENPALSGVAVIGSIRYKLYVDDSGTLESKAYSLQSGKNGTSIGEAGNVDFDGWEIVKQPVTWQEAIEALEGGKTTFFGLEDTALPANKASGTPFDPDAFNNVLNTVSAYGTPVIFTTRAFAQANLVPVSTWVSDVAREEMRNQGYLGRYMGADVIVLEQSFTDPSNSTKVLPENFAFIIPAGSNEKPIK